MKRRSFIKTLLGAIGAASVTKLQAAPSIPEEPTPKAETACIQADVNGTKKWIRIYG